jgi:hypothetical protein
VQAVVPQVFLGSKPAAVRVFMIVASPGNAIAAVGSRAALAPKSRR